jgi:uncharacterized protein
MEDIIASISRIITEDKRPDEVARPVAAQTEKTEILELTEVVDEDGSIRRVTPSDNPIAASAGSPGPIHPPVVDPGKPVDKGLQQLEAGMDMKLGSGQERILSSATSGAAAAAFAQLGALPRERRKEGELLVGGADRTLEGIVRDLLRPLLQTWLDENLPRMVERLVREEITRVVGDAGLR